LTTKKLLSSTCDGLQGELSDVLGDVDEGLVAQLLERFDQLLRLFVENRNKLLQDAEVEGWSEDSSPGTPLTPYTDLLLELLRRQRPTCTGQEPSSEPRVQHVVNPALGVVLGVGHDQLPPKKIKNSESTHFTLYLTILRCVQERDDLVEERNVVNGVVDPRPLSELLEYVFTTGVQSGNAAEDYVANRRSWDFF
jgi:hypothetical protein